MRRRANLLLGFILLVTAACLTYKAAVWQPDLYERSYAFDIWFDGDVSTVYNLETSRWERNGRRSFHPLWAYVSFPPVYAAIRVLPLDKMEAVRIFHSAIAGLWASGFFLLLLKIGLRRLDAVIFTALAGTTTAAFFWLPATETFAAGSASMFPVLAMAAAAAPASAGRAYLAGLSSIAVTITNWMAGLFLALLDLPWRKAAAVSAAVLATAIAGQHLQVFIYTRNSGVVEGAGLAPWIFPLEMGGPFDVLRVFFFSSVTSPELGFAGNYRHAAWPRLSLQQGGLFTGTAWAAIATPAWAALLALGGVALCRLKTLPRLRKLLALLILYQLLLHLLYGRETFLYSLHFVPLLVVVAALATFTRWRPVVLALALLMTCANAINNRSAFLWARDYAARSETLVAVDARQGRVRTAPTETNPVLLYRFWRDVLGWAPVLKEDATPEPAATR